LLNALNAIASLPQVVESASHCLETAAKHYGERGMDQRHSKNEQCRQCAAADMASENRKRQPEKIKPGDECMAKKITFYSLPPSFPPASILIFAH